MIVNSFMASKIFDLSRDLGVRFDLIGEIQLVILTAAVKGNDHVVCSIPSGLSNKEIDKVIYELRVNGFEVKYSTTKDGLFPHLIIKWNTLKLKDPIL